VPGKLESYPYSYPYFKVRFRETEGVGGIWQSGKILMDFKAIEPNGNSQTLDLV